MRLLWKFLFETNQILPNLCFRNSSNLGFKQRFPKWNFIESSSLRFYLLLPITDFEYNSSSGLEQKRPKWNLVESSAPGSTKHFQSKTLLKVKLYLSSSGLQSNAFQARFGCKSNSRTYNEFPSKALVKFPGRGSIKYFPSYVLVTVATCDLNTEFRSEILVGLSSKSESYKAFQSETLVKVLAGSLIRAQSNFSQVTFFLEFRFGSQTKMSQEDVNLNFASLLCYNSNSRLKENLTKSNCIKFQYKARRKTSKMQLCQKFQIE